MCVGGMEVCCRETREESGKRRHVRVDPGFQKENTELFFQLYVLPVTSSSA